MRNPAEIIRIDNLIKVFDPKKKKHVVAGRIDGNKFRHKVNSKHYYVKGGGYCLQKVLVSYLIKWTTIKYIILKSEKYLIKSKPKDWKKYGQIIDEGHGVQVCLNLKHTKKKKR